MKQLRIYKNEDETFTVLGTESLTGKRRVLGCRVARKDVKAAIKEGQSKEPQQERLPGLA